MVKGLGQGAYGKVVCVLSKESNTKYAMKIISKKLITNLNMVDQLKIEVTIMKEVQHENIVELICNFEDSKHIYLVMDLAEEGHLYSRLKRVGNYPENVAAKVTYITLFYLFSICLTYLKQ